MGDVLNEDPAPESEEIEQVEEEIESPEREEIEQVEREEIDSPEREEIEKAVAEPESSYDPNFTYKVLDDEYEMDDRIKKYIKTPEDEELFRDLLSRADGIDTVRQDRQVLRDDNVRLMETESTRQHAVQQLQDLVQKGDLKPFMDTWGLDDDKLAHYLQQRIALMNMPPEQRAAYEQGEQARMQNMTMAQQYQQLQQENTVLHARQVEQSVDQAINSQDIVEHARSYDTGRGQGAFKREVAALGDYYYRQGRGVVPADQLAREVVGKFFSQPQMQQPERHGASPARNQKVVVMDKNKPTLPRVRGGGASPIKSAPKSINDLRAMHKQRYGD